MSAEGQPLSRAAWRPTPGRLALAALAGLALWALWLLRWTLAPVAVAFVAAYAVHPLFERLLAWRRWRLGRSATVLLLMGVLALGLALFLGYLIPALSGEVARLRLRLPGYFAALHRLTSEQLAPWLQAHLGLPLPTSVAELELLVQEQLQAGVEALAGTLNAGLHSAWAGTLGALRLIFNVLLVPFFFFFCLRDLPRIKHALKGLLPPRHLPAVMEFVRKADETLANFLRGQLTVAAILAAAYSLGLVLIGVDLAILLGVLSGLLFLIPYLGLAIALALSLLLALLHYSGWGQLLWILALYIALPLTEMFVLTPRIVGTRLRLSPALVILALLCFGGLFGVLGVLVALPATALLRLAWAEALAAYQRSAWYRR